ncbi:MAG TPA: PqiC family protein [Steroidobacteraceae bacterium]|nr:PqiC family protein [Steroidobacteraceae bacterium]
MTLPAFFAPQASPAIAAVLTAAMIGLTACASSPPTQFYSLTPVSAQSSVPKADSATSGAMPLRVAAVHIPPTLDRREVVRRGAGDRLEISGERRWGAPFDEMVQHVLTQNLVERLPPGSVVLPSGPAPSGMASVVVDLLQFQSDAGGAVVLQGSWSLLPSGQSSPTLVRDFRYEDSASAQNFEDEAAAMSRLLGRLSDDIASQATAKR